MHEAQQTAAISPINFECSGTVLDVTIRQFSGRKIDTEIKIETEGQEARIYASLADHDKFTKYKGCDATIRGSYRGQGKAGPKPIADVKLSTNHGTVGTGPCEFTFSVSGHVNKCDAKAGDTGVYAHEVILRTRGASTPIRITEEQFNAIKIGDYLTILGGFEVRGERIFFTAIAIDGASTPDEASSVDADHTAEALAEA